MDRVLIELVTNPLTNPPASPTPKGSLRTRPASSRSTTSPASTPRTSSRARASSSTRRTPTSRSRPRGGGSRGPPWLGAPSLGRCQHHVHGLGGGYAGPLGSARPVTRRSRPPLYPGARGLASCRAATPCLTRPEAAGSRPDPFCLLTDSILSLSLSPSLLFPPSLSLSLSLSLSVCVCSLSILTRDVQTAAVQVCPSLSPLPFCCASIPLPLFLRHPTAQLELSDPIHSVHGPQLADVSTAF
jgi:hypothetical protein